MSRKQYSSIASSASLIYGVVIMMITIVMFFSMIISELGWDLFWQMTLGVGMFFIGLTAALFVLVFIIVLIHLGWEYLKLKINIRKFYVQRTNEKRAGRKLC